jgi:hypothetical protein
VHVRVKVATEEHHLSGHGADGRYVEEEENES